MSVTPVIATLAQKGGVAKTTTAANIAAWLAHDSPAFPSLRVLAVDAETQGHLALALHAHPPAASELTLGLAYQAAADGEDLSQLRGSLLGETDTPGVTLLRGGQSLKEIRDLYNSAGEAGEQWLSAIIVGLASDFDVVVVDSPPTLGPLQLGALRAADLGLVMLKGDDPLSLPSAIEFLSDAAELGNATPQLELVCAKVEPRLDVFKAIDAGVKATGRDWLALVPHNKHVQHAYFKETPFVLSRRSGTLTGLSLRKLAEDAYDIALKNAQETR